MNEEKLSVLIINDMVIFPNNEIRLEYENTFDTPIKNIVEKIDDDYLLLVNPIGEVVDDVTSLPSYGVLGRVKLKMRVPNGKTRIVLEGIKRVKIFNYTLENDIYRALYEELVIDEVKDEEKYINLLIKSLNHYVDSVPYMGNAVLSQLNNVDSLDTLTDLVASFLDISYDKKKTYITNNDPTSRCKNLIKDMSEELQYVLLEQKIDSEVEKELSEAQKEFFLREKMKAIEKELGESNSKDLEVIKLKKQLTKLKCSSKIKEKINSEILRYEALNSSSPEIGIIRDYLEWMINLPWMKTTKDNNSLSKVKTILDSTHYGLDEVKERILEYLAVKQNTNSLRSPILCLVGPPGVGKTSLAISIAKSLNRKVAKISVGGINDEAEIVGHRRTYIGANPGRIIQGIRKAGTANPVFIIDEIDKMTKDIKGDPASSLLEVLDPEQNSRFSDHYIEEEFDLSKVLFVATANYIEQIPYELRDRLEIINISSYTEYEKLDIAKNHLVPKLLEEHGLTPLQVEVSDSALLGLIRNYTKEAGVRELERMIATLFRKIVKKILLEKNFSFYKIEYNDLENILGAKKYLDTDNQYESEVGIVNGMAYTTVGGDILPIEATMFKGKGDLILTGSLGDVMQESCKIALSYIKANIKNFKIKKELLDEYNIHIHFPEGAVNKDGPSAGTAITTTLISLLTNKKVSRKLSMTGEITLRGKVLPIGGLKEKVIGAHRAGVRTIIIPKENEKDLKKINEDILKDIKFVTVKNYEEIYNMLFSKKEN